MRFVPERGRWVMLPDAGGEPQGVLAGLGKDPLDCAGYLLARRSAVRSSAGRPVTGSRSRCSPTTLFVLGWTQGGYRFLRYKSRSTLPRRPHLEPPAALDLRYVQAATRACSLARDLINTPANDMGPHELASAAAGRGAGIGGKAVIVGGEALTVAVSAVAAVGQGSPRAPRLIDLHFPRPGAPRITLVGKGVCFDTGGLDMKASAGMALMKKDMGGAACALATAQLLQELGVPIDLRVLVPAVENSVDGTCLSPRRRLAVHARDSPWRSATRMRKAGWCWPTRWRLPASPVPICVIDFATLTGAARVALGAELPAAYSGDADTAGRARGAGRTSGGSAVAHATVGWLRR